ncbi:MAG: TatD family hydrolase [Candidatus Saccharibacteria bacterium]|nr:TatD family hydrolase [Candidatus Saccharibacteria bacterium]
MLVDTHCHIHDKGCFELSPDETLAHMHENGVDKCIVIGTDPINSVAARDFALKNAEVWWTYGYHPNDYDGNREKLAQDLKNASSDALKSPKLVAIGEIGLDYHFDGYNRDWQAYLFENMLQIAQDMKLPVSFHIRDAFDDFWPIVDNFHLVTSVLHSFSDNEENLQQGMKRGLYFGVNGLSTFAKIPHPPLERIILETDAPFLTPKPFRGTINKPGYVKNIADWVAEYYGVNPNRIAEITTANAEKLFKI